MMITITQEELEIIDNYLFAIQVVADSNKNEYTDVIRQIVRDAMKFTGKLNLDNNE